MGKGRARGKIKNQDPPKSLSQLTKGQLVERSTRLLRPKFPDLPEEVLVARLEASKRPELYKLAQEPEHKGPMAVETIVDECGYDVLWLPPYHPDINPIEQGWGASKGYVGLENDGKRFADVKTLLLEAFKKVAPSRPGMIRETCKNEQAYMLKENIRPDNITEQERAALMVDIDEDD
ncbi:hypothetical protein BGZ70_001115 [Mortierella alpina]|uniref:Tc1-like transposase DDE domain-containing protein n=1 Tax=Mortierella alpina TaxID=64518 RepID=A0A9P6IWH6_MORAP|nr:hypothetical protein BGZ70_001115 [Mortierella alpina]